MPVYVITERTADDYPQCCAWCALDESAAARRRGYPDATHKATHVGRQQTWPACNLHAEQLRAES